MLPKYFLEDISYITLCAMLILAVLIFKCAIHSYFPYMAVSLFFLVLTIS